MARAPKPWLLGSTLTLVLLLGALAVQPATPAAETPQQRYDRLLEIQHRDPAPPLSAGAGVTAQDVVFQSATLDRRMRYRVLLPAGYSTSHRYYPVLYLLHGYMNPYYEWDKQTSLARYLEEGHHELVVILPQFDNSFYVNSFKKPADKYESYFFDDLLPHVEAHYRVRSEPPARAVAGVSMGGYGALLYGLRKPWKFALAASFSGPVDLMKFRPEDSRALFDPFVLEDVIGPFASDYRKNLDLFEMAGNADPKTLPYLWLSCGSEDGLLSFNLHFVELLVEKKARFEFHTAPGNHEWEYWDAELPLFLRALDRTFSTVPR